MDVFDSSVWLWGLLTDDTEPSSLVEEVKDGGRSVAVSAYIHDEVTQTLNQVQNASELQMTFNNTIADLDNVTFPDQEVIGQTYAKKTQELPPYQLLGTVLEIQPKDAPVFTFAFDVDDDTTLFVADTGFSLDTASHNVTNVKMQQVSTP